MYNVLQDLPTVDTPQAEETRAKMQKALGSLSKLLGEFDELDVVRRKAAELERKQTNDAEKISAGANNAFSVKPMNENTQLDWTRIFPGLGFTSTASDAARALQLRQLLEGQSKNGTQAGSGLLAALSTKSEGKTMTDVAVNTNNTNLKLDQVITALKSPAKVVIEEGGKEKPGLLTRTVDSQSEAPPLM